MNKFARVLVTYVKNLLRQGLEKMENEKQKKEQDQIRAKLREEKLRKKRELEINRSPQRSKFDDMNSDTR